MVVGLFDALLFTTTEQLADAPLVGVTHTLTGVLRRAEWNAP
jgi:hypothetical protein